MWNFSKCHNFFSRRQIDLKICMRSYFCIYFCLAALARLLHVHFCVFCHDDHQKSTIWVPGFCISGPSTEKSWTPCERSSKIMTVPKKNDFWNVLSMGEKSVQRGRGPTEWRTPRFSNVGPQRRFGRRMLRTIWIVSAWSERHSTRQRPIVLLYEQGGAYS